MRKFLEKFLTPEQLTTVTDAYKAKNPGESDLPLFIPKSRLDEEITKRKGLEEQVNGFEAAKKQAVDEAVKSLNEKLKAIPEDWKQQIETAKAETEKVKKSSEVTIKIHEAGARNVTAVKALIDETKPIDEELKRIRTSDPYLFSKASSVEKGTGSKGGNGGGDDDDSKDKGPTTEQMYRAVGLNPPTETK